MTKRVVKVISALICVVLIASAMAVLTSAADYRKGSNDISASYAASEYYERFKLAPITGDGPTDAIAIALSQIGYQESNTNGEYGGMVSGSDNYTEFNYNMGDFGVGYGGSSYPWCACFVSFCLYQGQCHDLGKISDWCRKNEGKEGYVWREVSCQKWVEQLQRFDMFHSSVAYKGTYVPQSGDLIFFTTNNKTSSHIGIVLYTDGGFVYTIEGNTSSGSELDVNGGGVYFKKYTLRSSKILGYGTLPYERNEEVTLIDYSGANPTEGLYVSTSEKPIFANANDSDSAYSLPKYSMFEVTEVVSNDVLKGKFTIGGAVVEGYVKNDSERIIQLSDNRNVDKSSGEDEDDSAIVNATDYNGYKNMCVDCFVINDKAENNDTFTVTTADKFGIFGWIGFDSEIESFGYAIDGVEDPMFDASFGAETEDAIKNEANGGEYGRRFRITVSADGMEVGEHTVNFLVKLENGKICIIDTATVTVEEKTTPPETETESDTVESTEETTEEVTEEITEETTTIGETESSVMTEDEQITTGDNNKKGCGSTVSAMAVILSVGTVCAFVKKKKED